MTHRRGFSKISAALAAALTGASLIGAAAQAQEGGPPPVEVVLEEARVIEVAARVWAPASVVPAVDAEIPAEVNGRVVWTAERGARLDAGDPIARLDDARLTLAYEEAQANVARLEADLDALARDEERQRSLVARGAGAESVLERAASQAAMARANLRSARAAAERLALDLDRAVIRAPFAGQVVTRMLDVGEFAREGAPVARLIQVDDKEIVARAPLAAARFVNAGDTIPLRDSEGHMFEGAVTAVVELGDALTRVVEIRAAAPADRNWIAGEAASLGAPVDATRSVVSAPRDALVLRAGGTFVFKVDGDDKAVRVEVDAGEGTGDYVEVRGEIAAGDRLVVRGAERLREGQTVKVLAGST